MARARNIKPGFFENEHLSECSAHARLLFIGLWTLADRAGRLEYRPKRIGAKLFPYEDSDIEAWVSDLEQRGFIKVYTVEGADFIEIDNFVKHQNPHPKEAFLNLPGPPDGHEPRKNIASPEKEVASNAPSPFPLPLSLGDDPASPCPASGTKYSEEFERFWADYPNRQKKGRAYTAWKRLSRDDRAKAHADVIERKAKHEPWLKDGGRFIPHPSTYINAKSWDDDIVQGGQHEASSGTDRSLGAGERARRAIEKQRSEEDPGQG